jgi:protocatechuate 3,4-dioxygenase beta subunit
VDTQLNRADIRSDPTDGSVRPGVPLALSIVVSRLGGQACTPLPGVMVDIWQCDHEGVYSGVQDPQFSTRDKKFLRGYQVTGADGVARFTTIYPGWYRGRTVHIHFKLRSPASQQPGYEFTSQLYFNESVTDAVFAKAPDAARGPRSTLNANDGIFRQGGARLMLDAEMQDVGYAGSFHVALEGV